MTASLMTVRAARRGLDVENFAADDAVATASATLGMRAARRARYASAKQLNQIPTPVASCSDRSTGGRWKQHHRRRDDELQQHHRQRDRAPRERRSALPSPRRLRSIMTTPIR